MLRLANCSLMFRFSLAEKFLWTNFILQFLQLLKFWISEHIFEWTKDSQGPGGEVEKVFILEPSNVIHQAVKFNGSFLALTINIQRFCRQKRVVSWRARGGNKSLWLDSFTYDLLITIKRFSKLKMAAAAPPQLTFYGWLVRKIIYCSKLLIVMEIKAWWHHDIKYTICVCFSGFQNFPVKKQDFCLLWRMRPFWLIFKHCECCTFFLLCYFLQNSSYYTAHVWKR